jgi:hypothetical protein
MSKVIELSDEEYEVLVEAAKKRHETPEQMLSSLVRSLSEAESAVYYGTDEMFAALDAYAAERDAGATPSNRASLCPDIARVE